MTIVTEYKVYNYLTLFFHFYGNTNFSRKNINTLNIIYFFLTIIILIKYKLRKTFDFNNKFHCKYLFDVKPFIKIIHKI